MGILRILVCFKVFPEFERIVDADWEGFGPGLDLSYVKKSFGCFDESALETALRLRDALKTGEAVCAALTLGPLPVPLCGTLFAVGFDQVFAPASPVPEFRPQAAAAALSAFTGKGNWDLILTGRQAGYADSGMVPFFLAEALGLPVISEAESILPLEGDAPGLVIERSEGNGRERAAIRLPALVIMGNSPVSALRAPSLAARMRTAKRNAEILVCEGGAESGGLYRREFGERFIREQSRKNCRFLAGGNSLDASVREISESLENWRGR